MSFEAPKKRRTPMHKHALSAWLLLATLSLQAKVRMIEPTHKITHTQTNRSRDTTMEADAEFILPEGDAAELKALWQESLIHDTRYKIGIFCEPIEPTTPDEQPALGIMQLCPLSYLQDISIYTCDAFEPTGIPEKVDLKCFPLAIKRSAPNMEAIIGCLDAVITNQLQIADLALSLNKQVWFIKETDVPFARAPQDKLHLVTRTENCCNVAPMMHDIIYHMERPQTQIVTAEVPVGELVDKITILEIKTERIDDAKKLENIGRELNALRFSFDEMIPSTPELMQLIQELKSANEALWQTEDLIRDKEREKCFDEEFVALARAVYLQNDERCRAKRAINELLGSRLIEEKSYKPYN